MFYVAVMGHNMNILPTIKARGRGALGAPKSRFDIQERDWFDDGWDGSCCEGALPPFFLKSSPILILDEATASVDVETERKIQLALQRLIKNTTTLIIAHRLSTIREADTIIFLQDGKIKEKGTHDELMNQGGAYAKYCKLQEKISL